MTRCAYNFTGYMDETSTLYFDLSWICDSKTFLQVSYNVIICYYLKFISSNMLLCEMKNVLKLFIASGLLTLAKVSTLFILYADLVNKVVRYF